MVISYKDYIKWRCKMDFGKGLKKLDVYDIGLIKLTMFVFALLVVSLSPAFASWVQSVNPWWFLVVFVVVAARPFHRYYIKK